MTSLAEIEQQRQVMLALLTLAVAEALAEFDEIATMSPQDAASLAREVFPLIVAEYGDMAALASADFYDEIRGAVVGAAAASFAAQLAPSVPDEKIEDALGWALAPLFNSDTPDTQTTVDRLANKVQWLVGLQGRDTIGVSAAADPVGTRYARYASANACAFCRLMATRGATYRTEESALVVVGEIDPRDPTGYALRGPRGTRQLGEKYHDNCRCIAVPVFPGDTLEEAPYVAQWRSDYDDAVKAVGGSKRADVSAILAYMREYTGAR